MFQTNSTEKQNLVTLPNDVDQLFDDILSTNVNHTILSSEKSRIAGCEENSYKRQATQSNEMKRKNPKNEKKNQSRDHHNDQNSDKDESELSFHLQTMNEDSINVITGKNDKDSKPSQTLEQWLQEDSETIHPVWIGNLPSDTTVSELRQFLESKVGNVLVSVHLCLKQSKNPNGAIVDHAYAFVNVPTAEKQMLCVTLFDGKIFKGEKLIVRPKRPSKFPSHTYIPGTPISHQFKYFCDCIVPEILNDTAANLNAQSVHKILANNNIKVENLPNRMWCVQCTLMPQCHRTYCSFFHNQNEKELGRIISQLAAQNGPNSGHRNNGISTSPSGDNNENGNTNRQNKTSDIQNFSENSFSFSKKLCSRHTLLIQGLQRNITLNKIQEMFEVFGDIDNITVNPDLSWHLRMKRSQDARKIVCLLKYNNAGINIDFAPLDNVASSLSSTKQSKLSDTSTKSPGSKRNGLPLNKSLSDNIIFQNNENNHYILHDMNDTKELSCTELHLQNSQSMNQIYHTTKQSTASTMRQAEESNDIYGNEKYYPSFLLPDSFACYSDNSYIDCRKNKLPLISSHSVALPPKTHYLQSQYEYEHKPTTRQLNEQFNHLSLQTSRSLTTPNHHHLQSQHGAKNQQQHYVSNYNNQNMNVIGNSNSPLLNQQPLLFKPDCNENNDLLLLDSQPQTQSQLSNHYNLNQNKQHSNCYDSVPGYQQQSSTQLVQNDIMTNNRNMISQFQGNCNNIDYNINPLPLNDNVAYTHYNHNLISHQGTSVRQSNNRIFATESDQNRSYLPLSHSIKNYNCNHYNNNNDQYSNLMNINQFYDERQLFNFEDISPCDMQDIDSIIAAISPPPLDLY